MLCFLPSVRVALSLPHGCVYKYILVEVVALGGRMGVRGEGKVGREEGGGRGWAGGWMNVRCALLPLRVSAGAVPMLSIVYFFPYSL